MGSAREDMKDQNGDVRTKLTSTTTGDISLSVGLHSLADFQQNDSVKSGDYYGLKVRKPYTIKKQRERWTEEEHNKFLEALRLYGRAWRRIEEHVASKTAVQIRSHAQKFFSKVARESSGNEENTRKPIEIPPPRPKRKHMHPYPRNIVKVNSGTSFIAEYNRSSSPNLSISGQENQSPISVLSAPGSEITGATGSNLPHGSFSPASSTADNQLSGLLPSETLPSLEEQKPENRLSSLDSLTDEERIPKAHKSKMLREATDFAKDGSTEVASTHSLKLFGKTILVTVSASANSENCQSWPCEETDKRSVQPSSWNRMGEGRTATDAERPWTGLSGGQAAHYYMQTEDENSNTVKVGSSSASFPCWNFNGGVSCPA